jgi:hypothetical protein
MMMQKPKESHVEFYAEIIGKLIGSVRSGIRTFIDDVKKGRRDKNQNEDEFKIMGDTQVIKEHENKTSENNYENSTIKMSMTQVQ